MSVVGFIRRALAMGVDQDTALRMGEAFEAEMPVFVPPIVPLTALDRKRDRDRDRIATKRDKERQSRDMSDSRSDKEAVSLPPEPPNLSQEITTPFTPLKGGVSPSKSRATRRCPESFSPSHADMAVAEGEGFTPGEIDRELAKIRDYQFSTAHSDWSAVFRNWIRKAADRKPKLVARDGQLPTSPKLQAKQANMARALRGAEIALSRREEF